MQQIQSPPRSGNPLRVVSTGAHSFETQTRVRRVQVLTLTWMSIEVAVGLFAAMRAHSPALFAFSGDSVVELLSAAVVLRDLRGARPSRRLAQVSAYLLFALAGFVALSSVLALRGRIAVETSVLGIILLAASAIFMPLLGRAKIRLAAQTHSATLRADAVQSSVCAYLAWIALIGLLVEAWRGIRWADPAAALLIVPIIVYEGRRALCGDVCGCCD